MPPALKPNDIGNRPAAPMVTADQGMNRRVRLTARLGLEAQARGEWDGVKTCERDDGTAHLVRRLAAHMPKCCSRSSIHETADDDPR
jgi:hypothetical protein